MDSTRLFPPKGCLPLGFFYNGSGTGNITIHDFELQIHAGIMHYYRWYDLSDTMLHDGLAQVHAGLSRDVGDASVEIRARHRPSSQAIQVLISYLGPLPSPLTSRGADD